MEMSVAIKTVRYSEKINHNKIYIAVEGHDHPRLEGTTHIEEEDYIHYDLIIISYSSLVGIPSIIFMML